MLKKGILLLLIGFLSIPCLLAQVLSESTMGTQSVLPCEGALTKDGVEMSLLTCSPGESVYELYGHSALRVKWLDGSADWVVNYGVFDFSAPHFVWRFVLGQTDYTLDVCHYAGFSAAYYREGRVVTEQVLNLSPIEEERILQTIQSQMQQPNWNYRYSFLYDNCTTRLISLIENSVEGSVQWLSAEDGKRTFRDMLHEFAQTTSPWTSLGQDLLLGEEVDMPLPAKYQMFSPVYAERFVTEAKIISADGDSVRQLVISPAPTVQQQMGCASHDKVNTTLIAVMGIAVLWLAMSLWSLNKRRRWQWADCTMLLIQATVGVIIFILYFWSEHPAVGSNWLILLFNPLPLVWLIYKLYQSYKGNYDDDSLVWLIEALVMICIFAWVPQQIPAEVYVLLLAMLVRGVVGMYLRKVGQRK